MTDAAARAGADRLLRAYQAQEKRFVERRFPLRFEPEVPAIRELYACLLYTSPSPRDGLLSRMPSSA